MTTLTGHDDDAVLPRFGYRQQFVRSLRHFESFAVAFSFISITTGIFTTFGFALATGGPRAIWTWPIVIVGHRRPAPPRETAGHPEPLNILAIDQGTSATKALLVGPGQRVLGAGEVPVSVRAVGPGGVEADPEELYRSVIGAGSRALAAAGAPADAVALANQGETVLAWDRRTQAPLTPAIVWQDRRSAAVCERLAGSAARLARLTGLPLDPYFAAPKMTWLRENLTGEGVVTTTDTWLLARLGGGYVTDASTASRTLLLDLDAAGWSAEACGIFGLDPATLPEVADCAAVTGETAAFGKSVPVAGLAVDQQAALLAERCFAAGQAKCTYGTGAFLLATTGATAVRSASGLSASIAWRLAGAPTYCLDGQVYTAGAAIRWLGEVGLLRDAGEIDEAGGSVPDSGGVMFLPSLAGLGAPHWLPAARGAFLGLGLATTQGAPHPGGRRGAGGVGRAAGRLGRQRPRRAADGAAGRRRADPVPAADAGPGRPAAAARRGVPHPGRDRARRGRAGQDRAGAGRRGGTGRGPGRGGGGDRAADRRRRGGGTDGGLRPGAAGDPGGGAVTGTPGTPPGAADVAIIGAGVVGTAIARELARYDLSIVVVDAATDVGTGTTKANTAILHSGFDAVPGSLESRLLRRGSALLRGYAARAGIPVERTGALLVAWTAEQRRALPEIAEKARQNGYTAIRPVSAAGLYQREPHLGPGALAGLEIPDESVICPWTTPLAYATEAVRAGARLELGSLVTGVRSEAGGHALATTRGTVRCRWLVNAAGLGGDVVDAMLGGGGFTIRPRRGELIVFDKLARPLLGSILLPVPTAATKGVLVAPTVYGNVLLGPTAEDIGDRSDTGTTAAGLAALLKAGRRIVPDLAGEEVTATYAGLRAATEHRDYQIRVDPARRYACVGGHQVDRAVRVAGDRRVRHRSAGRGGAAAGRARRGRRRPARDALHRGGGNAALPGRRADRRRPRVRADRLPLRAGHPRRDPRRAGEHRAARRRLRAAPPDQGDERPVPGLLLRRHGVGDDGGRRSARPAAAQPAAARPAAARPGPGRRPGVRRPGVRRRGRAGWRER